MGDTAYRDHTALNRADVAKLGLGTARLLMQANSQTAVALINAALDAGVSHLDVARSYGDGRTESVVGEVAQVRRAEMTIVTKAGLFPPGFVSRAHRRAHRIAGKTCDAPSRRSFHPHAIASSIEQSLRALKTDYVDALLLHDCTIRDISDELKSVLLLAKQKGMTRRVGIATGAIEASRIGQAHPEICEVVQIEVRAMGVLVAPPLAQVITHSVLAPSCLERRQVAWEQKLRDALIANPNGVVLFSSSQPDHIRHNAVIAQTLVSPNDRDCRATNLLPLPRLR
jgi:D-threo-aldose 1-dehydrogenase